jgi:hypothetical protein
MSGCNGRKVKDMVRNLYLAQFGTPYPKCLDSKGFQILEYIYCTILLRNS